MKLIHEKEYNSYINHVVENPYDLADRIKQIAIDNYGYTNSIDVIESGDEKWDILANGDPIGYFTMETLDHAVQKAKEYAQDAPKSLFGRDLSTTEIAKVERSYYEKELEFQLQAIVDYILEYIP